MIEYDGLGKQFDEMAKTFHNMPHVVIGQDESNKPNKTQNTQNKHSYIKCPYCYNTIQLTLPKPNISPPAPLTEQFSKFDIVKWFLYVCIIMVIGYAVYRLIWG